jgi:hypothetical protein
MSSLVAIAISIPKHVANRLKEAGERSGLTEGRLLIEAIDLKVGEINEQIAKAEHASKDTPIGRLLKEYGEITRGELPNRDVELALYHMLKRWQHRLPALDGRFHKTFRQCDVTDSGDEDMVIWNLLSASKAFWKLFEKHRPEKE